jgi:hypothetical protein
MITVFQDLCFHNKGSQADLLATADGSHQHPQTSLQIHDHIHSQARIFS